MTHAPTLNAITDLPRPRIDELPSAYAARLADRFVSMTPLRRRSEMGQFFTPVQVARFMARMAEPRGTTPAILDPGAGAGVLSCALCEALAPEIRNVRLDAFEVDRNLAALCNASLQYAKGWLADRGVNLAYNLRMADFVLARAGGLAPGLFEEGKAEPYDVIITNPPYFKLPKADPRSVAASAIVHGQPNIYAIFMAISASLLAQEGIMVTITPRSFATGDYFSRCREYMFSRVVPEAVHLFHSRKEAFKNDAVLQENVIIKARRGRANSDAKVCLSVSQGPQDIDSRKTRIVKLSSVIDISSSKRIFHIPAEDTDEAVIRFVKAWPDTLHSLCLEVSTGPVVAFRARRFLMTDPGGHVESAPLLWLQNVRAMSVEWPLDRRGKPQYVVENQHSRPLLIPNGTYVVLRRFSAKEEARRLVAAPLVKDSLPGRMIGLENHLNYIYRPHGRIEDEEAFGLAALLGSNLLDRYFRISNGNTQVNAAEIRALPLPARPVLTQLGREIRRQLGLPIDVDLLCEGLLRVPRGLRCLSKAG